ncbi:protein farnesyltransferase subunit beta [Nematocida homosporus]|uniref:protein farnesyltransferase subunit beta n=1 Tax=Nematocida homosporus TaxID=1912981 RepID=UPI00221EEC0D|nr:protein farnesyltransferase subunit beta [Nematocida homosporus]KAI5186106.1 protein farnesyltransferase subunit beta [Nematocida homosporus]
MYTDEGIETQTSIDAYTLNMLIRNKKDVPLNIEGHLAYLKDQLTKPISSHLSVIVPWVSTWLVNGFYVLLGKEKFKEELKSGYLQVLDRLATDILSYQTTGFGGNRDLPPNLGNTYAALSFLRIMGRLEEVDKDKVVQFIQEMKVDGGFTMHVNGEVDARSLYCAIASYSLLFSDKIDSNSQLSPLETETGKGLFAEAYGWICDAQTYEGGFAALPGEEAHGGYTYCAIASLQILGKPIPNEELLSEWLYQRQDFISKGFNGRTNKGVDSCYNFWVGGSMKMLNMRPVSVQGLITYTLSNCQVPTGGLSSVPRAVPKADVYHTCYALLGLYIQTATDFNTALGVPV